MITQTLLNSQYSPRYSHQFVDDLPWTVPPRDRYIGGKIKDLGGYAPIGGPPFQNSTRYY